VGCSGGVRINLPRFFSFTGLVLVFVAAGLLATAAHTAHEAGWINSLQGQAIDLSWLVQPGTVSGSLLTGMLGLQPSPTVVEALAYLLYAVPMTIYVLWPQQLRLRGARLGARRPGPAGNPA
jgi:high-affinity iron transporter